MLCSTLDPAFQRMEENMGPQLQDSEMSVVRAQRMDPSLNLELV